MVLGEKKTLSLTGKRVKLARKPRRTRPGAERPAAGAEPRVANTLTTQRMERLAYVRGFQRGVRQY